MLNRIVSLFLSLILTVTTFFQTIPLTKKTLRILVPENWEMNVGDSRSLTYIFSKKNKTNKITWSVSPENIATVDEWGRVTACSVGEATVSAVSGNLSDNVTLNVVASPTLLNKKSETKNYGQDAVEEVENLQKIVTRYPLGSTDVPKEVSEAVNIASYQSAVTADGAKWEITDYGVLRTDENSPTERDREQRFMGDRYFYSADTTDGKVLAIIPDGENGIWTVMEQGYTHIAMTEMSGIKKAESMSENTQKYIERHGYVAEALKSGTSWITRASDNDGLWTSMYGGGELMRYAVMRENSSASAEEIAEARETATKSVEAILMLHFISMRSGTTQAYIRRQLNGTFPGGTSDRWLSAEALELGGNNAVYMPSQNPSEIFKNGYRKYLLTGKDDSFMNNGYFSTVDPSSWSNPLDPENANKQYAKQTRLLKGFVARTYFLSEENESVHDNIYWKVNNDKTATGVSSLNSASDKYLINNENLRDVSVDASGEIPKRLWDRFIGSDYTPEDITYKGDTSADELIGHVFILKLAYDILAPEDSELKDLIVTAINNLAQHLSDNDYMLVDGSGQPTTWSNFSRDCFSSSSAYALAPLHSIVLLSIFKTAAYVTGYQKWENEYKLLALDPAYNYSIIATQHQERTRAAISYTLGSEMSSALPKVVELLKSGKIVETLYRVILNYSDEEMAMLAFYLLFQLEDSKTIRANYSLALDDWWSSIKYSENPLWYYIYQLAHPNQKIKDAYGNNILETSAWSLSRHPIDTICYLASNDNRDDIGTFDLTSFGLDNSHTLSFRKNGKTIPAISQDSDAKEIINFAYSILNTEWAVAAPDERAHHKYNSSSYSLESHYYPYQMDASTTYTLPFWLGMYHGMLK